MPKSHSQETPGESRCKDSRPPAWSGPSWAREMQQESGSQNLKSSGQPTLCCRHIGVPRTKLPVWGPCSHPSICWGDCRTELGLQSPGQEIPGLCPHDAN